MFYQISHGDAPPYLCDMVPQTVGDKNDYNLCSTHKMDLPFTRFTCYRRSFFHVVIREWNNLTYDTIIAPSIKDFKIAICKKKEPNMLYYYEQRWPSIHHARIRMACRKLNQHLFHNHLIDNPSCACGHPVEDPTHFFLNCPRYAATRTDFKSNHGCFTVW